ncbi:MAG TPA: GAF domain-containing sensor histidine kinase, partial [Anaerolineales bacterium]|nr:GAF domain-containing sensor histidine kinase [Anaerolineales bacterium]
TGNLGAVFTQIYRYKRVSNSVEKEQIKWVVYGLSLCVIGYLISGSVILNLGDPNGSDLSIKLLFVVVSTLSVLLIPISIAVAILRYRLWDINPLINRTVVYASLTALVVGIYVLIVSYLSFLFRTQSNFFISLIATGMVAVLFQPLREWLQQGVNHLMYGERDEPEVVLSRLGQRLEASLEPDSVLPSVVETVGQALKLPYVAIALKDGTDFALAAEYGRFVTSDESKADLTKMPLTYQSETVGELIVAPRASNERFSPADKKLLSILSQQAGAAAHTIRLTHELRNLNLDLQKSREELVTAREEERRRIRRDLHDGVGPILASLLQRLDAVRLLIPRDPEKAASIAEALKGQVKSTIADIRRLVYALRPPILDELGLVSAIREYTADYQGAGSLQVTLNAPETLPRLPAAVEVAAYRIVLEAFANVVHHSQATKCVITIRLEAQQTASLFCVDIQDNGQGLPEKHHAGVGMVSMRERTSELGGSIRIEASRSTGTRILACLPFSEEEK